MNRPHPSYIFTLLGFSLFLASTFRFSTLGGNGLRSWSSHSSNPSKRKTNLSKRLTRKWAGMTFISRVLDLRVTNCKGNLYSRPYHVLLTWMVSKHWKMTKESWIRDLWVLRRTHFLFKGCLGQRANKGSFWFSFIFPHKSSALDHLASAPPYTHPCSIIS